jgi:hypothetical protein
MQQLFTIGIVVFLVLTGIAKSVPANSRIRILHDGKDQVVSPREKQRLIRAIKSIYGDTEKVTADKLQLIETDYYPHGVRRTRGVMLLRMNNKVFILTDFCDNDWTEMWIWVYRRPYKTASRRSHFCETRKLKLKLVEVTKYEPKGRAKARESHHSTPRGNQTEIYACARR